MIEKVKAYRDQSIVDLAIQETGSVEGLVQFAALNDLAVDEDPAADAELKADTEQVINLPNRTYFKSSGVKISTGRVE